MYDKPTAQATFTDASRAPDQAPGKRFSTGVQGQRSSFIMSRDTSILTPHLQIVLIV